MHVKLLKSERKCIVIARIVKDNSGGEFVLTSKITGIGRMEN